MKVMLKTHLFNSKYYRICSRFIFSKTGTWDPEVNLETKLEIEDHWKACVAASNINISSAKSKDKPKFYVLAMFPYPSGSLHMGHARVYTISDTIARFHRMHGRNVIHPMGWDAFGLPAENAARTRGVDPALWTRDNVAAMKEQLQRLGLCLDWEREINTSSPDYYAGTQQIFLQLWKSGLVYQDKSMVNWDPVDLTVLADEQVDAEGHSWRSGAKVERRLLTQWFIKTTKFAKQLLEGLDNPILEEWRDIIQLQKHWIGECDGTLLTMPISEHTEIKNLKVWTRHPEDHGLFIAVSKQHSLNKSEKLVKTQPNPDIGLVLNINVKNPLHGNALPIIVIDLPENMKGDSGYMGVASLESDKELATALGLEIHKVTTPDMTKEQAILKAQQLGIGGDEVSSHLRDWLISRQRRWGTPIPLVKCKSCGNIPIPDNQLPVTLPEPHVDLQTWKIITCPNCGKEAERETDTMDTFVDSSWYFLRFLDPHNSIQPFSPNKVASLMPVDLYVGGKEHAVLHLYYARFMGHFLHSIGWLEEPEPFRRLLVQGMVMGKSYQVKKTGKYLSGDQVEMKGKKVIEKTTGDEVIEGWEKMSKSKYNGVDPNHVLTELGCDATRLLLLADVAPTSHRKWSADTYPGILNWQHRLWLTVTDFINIRNDSSNEKPVTEEVLASEETRLWDSRNFYISGTTFNYNLSQQLSVAVTKMQGLTNSIRRTPKPVIAKSVEYERALAAQIVMLAPMAPHFASELWTGFTSIKSMLSNDFDWNKLVLQQSWPQLDSDYKLDFNIQLNHIEVCSMKIDQASIDKITRSEALEMALSNEELRKSLGAWIVKDCTLKVRKGYDISLNILSKKPEGMENIPKTPKEKKKKKTKLKAL